MSTWEAQEKALKIAFLFFTKLRNDAESNLTIVNYFPGSVFLAESLAYRLHGSLPSTSKNTLKYLVCRKIPILGLFLDRFP